MQHVIIGNGIAGVCAAEAIRRQDATAEIALIGDETFPPYSRPMISYVLEGSQPHHKLPVRPQSFYSDERITALLGQRVTGLDVDQRRVVLADGGAVDFDRLLIACGADPRPLQADGVTLKNIFYLRTEAHVQKQLHALAGARRALVLGGGLVGFKAAYALLRRGLEVTLLITSAYPLAMQIDPVAGAIVQDEMLRHGLKVATGESVVAFEGKDVVQAALTDAGRRLPCDLVIIGKGVRPALRFLPKTHIRIDAGVEVDAYLQSSVPGIYAAGDAAELLDIARGRRWVNALWPEAAAQGRVAGLNMAGREVAYPGSLSRNVMRVFDLDLLTVGNAHPAAEEECLVVRSGGAGRHYYRHLVFKADLLVGAVLINRIEQGGVLRALIENRVPIREPLTRLAEPGFNFAQLLV